MHGDAHPLSLAAIEAPEVGVGIVVELEVAVPEFSPRRSALRQHRLGGKRRRKGQGDERNQQQDGSNAAQAHLRWLQVRREGEPPRAQTSSPGGRAIGSAGYPGRPIAAKVSFLPSSTPG